MKKKTNRSIHSNGYIIIGFENNSYVFIDRLSGVQWKSFFLKRKKQQQRYYRIVNDCQPINDWSFQMAVYTKLISIDKSRLKPFVINDNVVLVNYR